MALGIPDALGGFLSPTSISTKTAPIVGSSLVNVPCLTNFEEQLLLPLELLLMVLLAGEARGALIILLAADFG